MAATEQDIDNQKQLLAAHRQTLAGYLRQRALLGSANTPPHVLYGISESRAGIRDVKEVLRGWEQVVEDHPNDNPLPGEKVEFTVSSEVGTFSPAQHWKLRSYASYISIAAAMLFLVLVAFASNQIGKQSGLSSALQTVMPLQTSIADIAGTSATKGKEQAIATVQPTISAFQTSMALASLRPATKLVTVTQIVAAEPNMPEDILRIKAIWSPVYVDNFQANDFNWPVDDNHGDGVEKSAYKESLFENRYHIEVTAGKNGLESLFVAPDLILEDNFYLEIEVTKPTGDADGYYGIIFRYLYNKDTNKSSGYIFRINNIGHFVFIRVLDEEHVTLLSGQVQVNRGEINKLGVLAEDGIYKLYVNNTEVASKSDTLVKKGIIGVDSLHRAGEHAVMEYDNLNVLMPKP